MDAAVPLKKSLTAEYRVSHGASCLWHLGIGVTGIMYRRYSIPLDDGLSEPVCCAAEALCEVSFSVRETYRRQLIVHNMGFNACDERKVVNYQKSTK